MFLRKTLRGGGLRFLAVCAMITLSAPLLINSSATTATASEDYQIPECPAGWTVTTQYDHLIKSQTDIRGWIAERSVLLNPGNPSKAVEPSLSVIADDYNQLIIRRYLGTFEKAEVCNQGSTSMGRVTTSYKGTKLVDTFAFTSDGWLRHWLTPANAEQIAGFQNDALINGNQTENKELGIVTFPRLMSDPETGEYIQLLQGLTIDGNKKIVPNSTIAVWQETYRKSDTEISVYIDANGGTFGGDYSTRQIRIIRKDQNMVAKMTEAPTRPGYTLVGWNTAANGSGLDASINMPSDEQVLYAQWEKDTGDPTYADIDCNNKQCAIVAGYSGSQGKYRTLATNGTDPLQWVGTGIKGVRLDGNGYDPHSSCPDDTNICYYVSLEKPSAQQDTNQVVQMPTTGAPEGLSVVGVLAFAVALGGLVLVAARRRMR